MQAFKNNRLLQVGLGVFVLYLCIRYWPTAAKLVSALIGAAMPLIVGCVIAYLVNILMSTYERWYFPHAEKKFLVRSRRPVCMLGAFITLVAVVVLILWLIVPQLISCVQVILAEVPGFLENAVALMGRYGILPETILETLRGIDWHDKIGEIVKVLTTGVGNVATFVVSALSSVFSGIVAALASIIFSTYVLSEKEKLSCQFRKLGMRFIKQPWRSRLGLWLRTLNDCFRKYIVGQCIEALILGVLCTLGMLILRLPYATMIGALSCFTALIPVVGAYIGAAVGAFMILTVSPLKALIFLVFIVLLQQLEGNLIYPRVVGSSIGLPGIWVLAAVTVGGGVLGIPGMLLAVPVAATVYRLLGREINRLPAKKPSDSRC